jgi:MFS family permease
VPLLIGLTEKGQVGSDGRLHDWLSWEVGGLLLIAAVALVVFIAVERKVKEPLIPLDLFHDRTTAGINAAVFCLGFAMFTAVIYLPRFYQTVRGVSATQSGYEIWPLLVGLIGGSILAGQLISRTGRYRALMLIAVALLVTGGFLMTHLQPGTDNLVLWTWMFVMGAGIGPGMAAYTVVIQAAVPLERLGVATSTMTLLRQIGGTVSLAVAGTLFNQAFAGELPSRLAAAGVPLAAADRIVGTASSGSLSALGVAGELVRVPELQPLVPRILVALHQAETAAIAQLFWLTIVAACAAFLFTLLIRELPLRSGPALRREALEEVTAVAAERTEPPAAAATPAL